MIDRLLVSHGFGIIRYLPFLQGITRHACLTSYQMIKLSGALIYKRKIQPSDFVPRHIM